MFDLCGAETQLKDEDCHRVLESVGLLYLAKRWYSLFSRDFASVSFSIVQICLMVCRGLDTEAAWADLLSGGEQQRLGLARLFLHKPTFAIMDESTSALDIPLETKCMTACKSLGISLISVAHRPSLLAYHDNVLKVRLPFRLGFLFLFVLVC